MSKLYNLRTLLSLEDAAKRLSVSFSEAVTYQNVLELVIEGRLPLSWFPGRIFVKPVHKIDGDTQFATHGDELIDTWEEPPEYRESEETVRAIDIIVRLDLDDRNNQLHDWLRILRNDTGNESDDYQISDPNGFYVYAEPDAEVWRVMEYFGATSDGAIDVINGDNGIYRPRRLAPKRAELVIQRDDLEYLERTVEALTMAKESQAPSSCEAEYSQLTDESSKKPTEKSRLVGALRAEKTDLRIIGALLDVISIGIPGELKNQLIGPVPGWESEAKLIIALGNKYGEYEGFKKRNLEKKFAAAKEIFKA